MRRGLAIALLLPALAGAEDLPGRVEGSCLLLNLPASILQEAVVEEHLGSGLTNSFVLEVRAQAPGKASFRRAAALDVRYEPWDEVYITSRRNCDGRRHQDTLPSRADLEAWFSEATLAIDGASAVAAHPTGWTVEVTMSFVPFSEAERVGAQEWFSESIAASRPERQGSETQERGQEPGYSRVIDVIVATSIVRESLMTREWTVKLSVP